MTPQSRDLAPPILLTRPVEQGDRFSDALRDRLGPQIRIIAAPLLMPRFQQPVLPDIAFAAVIFTSGTAVQAIRRISATLPARAWCVGQRTADLAAEAGFAAISADGDAAALVAAVLAAGQPGPLLHLRGKEVRGDVANMLNSAGTETHEAIVYAQQAQPLTAEARAVLAQDGPVIVPLFSPRTAALFAARAAASGVRAPLRVVAMSPAVAEALGGLATDRLICAARPDAASMLDAVAAICVPPEA